MSSWKCSILMTTLPIILKKWMKNRNSYWWISWYIQLIILAMFNSSIYLGTGLKGSTRSSSSSMKKSKPTICLSLLSTKGWIILTILQRMRLGSSISSCYLFTNWLMASWKMSLKSRSVISTRIDKCGSRLLI